MYWNSSERWHGHRHHRNGWIVPVVVIGLIILTHGWILILPLMLLVGFALMAFVVPKVLSNMRQNGWNCGEWSREWQEKRKRHFQDWGGSYGEKPKRGNPDDIEYV